MSNDFVKPDDPRVIELFEKTNPDFELLSEFREEAERSVQSISESLETLSDSEASAFDAVTSIGGSILGAALSISPIGLLKDSWDTYKNWTGQYKNGGASNTANKFIFETAGGIISGEVEATEENFDAFYNSVKFYFDGGIPRIWFNKHLDADGESGFKKLLESAQNAKSGLIYALFDAIETRWHIDESSSPARLILVEGVGFEDDKNKLLLQEALLNSIKEGSIFSSINEIVGESLRSYDYAKYKIEASSRIGEFIRNRADGANKQIIYKDKEYWDFYLKLNLSSDGKYSLSDEIYKGSPTEIPADKLTEEDIKFFQVPETPYPRLLYPSLITTGANGEKNQNFADELSKFTDLDGADVAKYPFEYQTVPYLWKNFGGINITPSFNDMGLTSLIKKLVNSGEFTINDEIEFLLASRYLKFVQEVGKDLLDDGGQLDTLLSDRWAKSLETKDNNIELWAITFHIIFEKLIHARKTVFDALSDALDDEESPGEITEDERKKAYEDGFEAFKSGKPPKVEEKLTEEELENRKKFFKQCALLMNLPTLRVKYDEELRARYENKAIYDDRFYMAYSKRGGQEKLLSNMLTSKNEQKLLEIENHVLSSLMPKIRLFKVSEKNGRIKNTEFVFNATADDSLSRAFSSAGRIGDTAASIASAAVGASFGAPQIQAIQQPKFLGGEFDKGSGCGLKEFSFEFNGTNPAEARNDIKATLKLYFQSFNDFIRTRKAKDGKTTYRYVDLIIQPTPDPKTNKVEGIEVVSDREFHPSFYRIRADVGYYTDGIKDEELKKAIEVSNKSLFLNMVDHDIQFKTDGSVEISISYRAYVESLLKHPKLDALASPELIEKRQENARLLALELSKKRCSKERIQELQVATAAAETVLLRKSLSSILSRLRERDAIYQVQVNDGDRQQFLTDGFFKKCKLNTGVKASSNGSETDVGVVLSTGLPENSDEFNFVDDKNGVVQFFFFGDLLYTILDCVFKYNSGKLRPNVGFANSKIILGSFEFDPFQIFANSDTVFNIAQMPISVDFFSRWFVDEVMSQQSTRKTFPVMNFIRSLTNQLIKKSLLEGCVNRKIEKSLVFRTSQVTAHVDDGVDPLSAENRLKEAKRVGMEVSDLRSRGVLPLRGGGDNQEDPNNFFNYIVVSTGGSSLSYSGTGRYLDDIEQGRLHVNIGQNSGLVKSISLSKSDQQYIREARFFQQGIDGLLQLSAVYVATLEMFGNTLFYPGMEFFFNPYGLGGGTDFGSPTDRSSVANKLGIGGYHTITSVRSSITPGSFKTTVAGQQYYSGDGSGNPNLKSKNSQSNQDEDLSAYRQEDTSAEGADACKTTIQSVYNFNEQETEQQNGVEATSPEAASNPPEDNVLVYGEDLKNIQAGPGVYKVGGETLSGEFVIDEEIVTFGYVSTNFSGEEEFNSVFVGKVTT